MQVPYTPKPGATATLRVVPRPADEVERLAAALNRLGPEDLDAWRDVIDRGWARELDRTRQLRNFGLTLGVASLASLPHHVAGVRSDDPLRCAAGWGALVGLAVCFGIVVSQTLDLARHARAGRGRAHPP